MQKKAYIDGYCAFLNDEVSIEAIFTRYAPLGAEPSASLIDNRCEYLHDCPHADRCPVLDQEILWNDL